MKTKPLPCPFCGGTKLQLLHGDWGWGFMCKKCDALGPWVKGKDAMIAKWNRRAVTGSAEIRGTSPQPAPGIGEQIGGAS